MEILGLLTSSTFLVSLLIFYVILLLILREFNCWYFKINKIVDILEKNQEIQKETNRLLDELKK